MLVGLMAGQLDWLVGRMVELMVVGRVAVMVETKVVWMVDWMAALKVEQSVGWWVAELVETKVV